LKKESTDGVYISAVELSDELKGMDFKCLTTTLRAKVGLLQKAEETISVFLSMKKEWLAFYREIALILYRPSLSLHEFYSLLGDIMIRPDDNVNAEFFF